MSKLGQKSSVVRKIVIVTVCVLVGIFLGIATVNFIRLRNSSSANAAINNLRQIDAAVKQWELTNKLSTASTAMVTNSVSPSQTNSPQNLP
jgi:hypothetical protein